MGMKQLLGILPIMMSGMMNNVEYNYSPFRSRTQFYEPKYDKIRVVTDKVMEALVLKGICYIDKALFYELYESLPKRMRGQVLFHSERETKKIFITYTKLK